MAAWNRKDNKRVRCCLKRCFFILSVRHENISLQHFLKSKKKNIFSHHQACVWITESCVLFTLCCFWVSKFIFQSNNIKRNNNVLFIHPFVMFSTQACRFLALNPAISTYIKMVLCFTKLCLNLLHDSTQMLHWSFGLRSSDIAGIKLDKMKRTLVQTMLLNSTRTVPWLHRNIEIVCSSKVRICKYTESPLTNHGHYPSVLPRYSLVGAESGVISSLQPLTVLHVIIHQLNTVHLDFVQIKRDVYGSGFYFVFRTEEDSLSTFSSTWPRY